MISYADALELLLSSTVPMPAQTVALAEAKGRVLSSNVCSPQCLPPFDNAAMDGFALYCGGAGIDAGTELAVQGWQAAGDGASHGSDGSDGAWEIMTGARMPEGFDTVVPIEHVDILEQRDGRPQRIRVSQAVTPGQHVRLRGQDVGHGEDVLPAGTTLDINACTLLHAIGVADVQVRARPRVAVIATGKELVSDASVPLGSGQIRDSNRPYLVGRLKAAGAEVVWQGVVGDEVAAFDAAVDEALRAGAMVLISTGAVSQGRYDFIPGALRARGAEIGFHKVAIRPGKPVLFARLKEGAMYFGLPGNPVSAAVGQRFFVEPVLRRLLGLGAEPIWSLPLTGDVRKPPGWRFHARARVEIDGNGQLAARVIAGQESFRLMSMVQANAWVVLDGEDSVAPAGSRVQVQGWGHNDPVQGIIQEESR